MLVCYHNSKKSILISFGRLIWVISVYFKGKGYLVDYMSKSNERDKCMRLIIVLITILCVSTFMTGITYPDNPTGFTPLDKN